MIKRPSKYREIEVRISRFLPPKGYFAIVVSNQSGIARGLVSEEIVDEINKHLKDQTGVDEVYYCPHLPPEDEAIPPYRIICSCRKPKPGMLLKAATDHEIDLTRSYMVGDRDTDLEAGRNAGVMPVGVNGFPGGLKKEDASFKTLLDFAKWLR